MKHDSYSSPLDPPIRGKAADALGCCAVIREYFGCIRVQRRDFFIQLERAARYRRSREWTPLPK